MVSCISCAWGAVTVPCSKEGTVDCPGEVENYKQAWLVVLATNILKTLTTLITNMGVGVWTQK